MRAVVVHSFGGPEVLELVDVPEPIPATGQIRIQVEAATLNPVDLATRAGVLVSAGLMLPRDRVGIGWDVAGTVDALGPGVTEFALGDRVIGLSDRLDLPLGTHAEQVVLDADAVASTPDGLTAVEAATLPLNALTAAQALDLLALEAGDTVLVTGAAGAVGGYAVELATHLGLRAIAVAGADDEALVKELGAHWFVPRTADLADEARGMMPGGVAGTIDAASVGIPARDATRGGGAFVAVIAGAAPLPLRGIRVHNVWIRADGNRLAELATLAAAGTLTQRVAGTYALETAPEAHERLARGGMRGRLVFVP